MGAKILPQNFGPCQGVTAIVFCYSKMPAHRQSLWAPILYSIILYLSIGIFPRAHNLILCYYMHMDKQTLQKIAARAVARAWDRLALRWPATKLGTVPQIEINGRLKTTAGRAWLETGKIDISKTLMIDFTRQIITETIPHECAHIAAYRIFGYGVKRGESHGKPWAMMMQDLGLPAEIYHDMIEKRVVKQMARKNKC